MPAHNSWQLIVAGMQHSASSLQRQADEAVERFADDGSSNVVNALRFTSMQMVMIAVGGFSMLEGILEQTKGWTKPFQELDQRLRSADHDALADQFMAYKLAINVLKHGSGESYERLRLRSNLPFRVKSPDERFFDEGDISEIPGLVLVDYDFVLGCAEVIEATFTALRIPRLDV